MLFYGPTLSKKADGIMNALTQLANRIELFLTGSGPEAVGLQKKAPVRGLNLKYDLHLPKPSGFSEKELVEGLHKVVATFPPGVVERGINRNWSHYLFLLKSLRPFWGHLPDVAQVCDIGAGAAV